MRTESPTGNTQGNSDVLATAARRVLPPIVAFLAARLRLWQSGRYVGQDSLAAAPWARWDSAHYFSIADRGYELFSCSKLPGYDPTLHCGNAAWLPGYPLLIRAIRAVCGSNECAGAFIAGLFALLCLALIWNVFLDAELSLVAVLTLTLAAFFPGHVYHHAVFPVSMCTFFNLLALQACGKRQFLRAGIAGACGAFTYSSGLFLAAVLGLYLLVAERRQPLTQQVQQWLMTSGIVALGFVAFLAMLHVETGTWRAYFLVQAKYAYQPTWPWMGIARAASTARLSGPHITGAQTFFVAVLACSLLAAAARQLRTKQDALLAVFLLIYWWVPLALGGSLSIYRAESMLLPAVVLAKKLPAVLLLGFILLAFILAAKMDVLFFKNVLV